MKISSEVRGRIEKVLESQKIAVLGTSMDDEPYSCLVGYAITDDFRNVIFATMRARLKYRNIVANPRVTLIVDNRDEMRSDFNETTSITMIGTAEDVMGEDRGHYVDLLLKRHPVLSEFVDSPDCAIIKVSLDKMYIVSEFESVIRIG